jgi:hypothetical protein
MMDDLCAPGSPGILPRWTSSAKSGVGTSLNPNGRVWFTLSHGILNEVYYPRIDRAAIRGLSLIVTGEKGFFPEEKGGARWRMELLAPGVPSYPSPPSTPGGLTTSADPFPPEGNCASNCWPRPSFTGRPTAGSGSRMFRLSIPASALNVADLPTAELPAGKGVAFTFFWPEAGRWEGVDCSVGVE